MLREALVPLRVHPWPLRRLGLEGVFTELFGVAGVVVVCTGTEEASARVETGVELTCGDVDEAFGDSRAGIEADVTSVASDSEEETRSITGGVFDATAATEMPESENAGEAAGGEEGSSEGESGGDAGKCY